MAQFSVKTNRARIQADDEQKLMRELANLEDSVRSIGNNLGFKIASKANIRARLNQAANQIDAHQKSMGQMHSALVSVLDRYNNTEQKILGDSNLKNTQNRNAAESEYVNGDAEYNSSHSEKKNGNQTEHGGKGRSRLRDDDPSAWNKMKNIWDEFADSAADNFKGDFRNAIIEGSGNTVVRAGGIINTVTAIGRNNGSNGFVIVNPNVLPTTSKMISVGNKIVTGAKIGLPIIGGLVDYATLVNDGESHVNAGVKAVAHVGIGLAGGKAGAAIGAAVGSVIPGAGTVVGAAVGFVAGVAITTVGNLVFDHVYDKYLSEHVENAAEKVSETVKEAGNKVKNIAEDIGGAFVDGWNKLGTVFG